MRFGRAFCLGALVLSLIGNWVLAGPGEVLSDVKIADGEGGFTGLLDPSDSFGSALAVLGDDDQAAELYPLMREPLENVKCSSHGALMPETAAGIAAACGRAWDAAEAHFRTALRYAREFPHKLEEPQIRYWYAKMLIERSASGDREKARELLNDAIRGYRSISMPLHLEMAKELAANL